MKADCKVSFSPPLKWVGGDVVREITFHLAFNEGELEGLQLDLVGARLRRNARGRLHVTWPAVAVGRAGGRHFYDFIRGADSPEARRRLIEMFESQEQSG